MAIDLKSAGDVEWRRVILLGAVLLTACDSNSNQSSVAPVTKPSVHTASATGKSILSPAAEVGCAIFFDARLSASGKQSCASCHDPAHAYAPANSLAVQLGGPNLDRPGTRAVPSLMYKEFTLSYSDKYENPDHVSPPGPGGGFAWDGRFNSLAEQANTPLTAPNEMANGGADEIVDKLAQAPYIAQFKAAFGADIFEHREQAYSQVLNALEAFQMEDSSFHPFSSKFDLYTSNKIGGALTVAEQRGFRVFIDAKKGNCIACHLLGSGNRGSQNMTSDYSFAAIGVPRNPEIPANADPKYFDLGLCGPLRIDHLPRDERDPQHDCGLFKTPILRNVATRNAFMHNGVFHTLREALKFYATRDTTPEKWYPKDSQGRVQKFDDLPVSYRASLDHQMPLDLRVAGSAPVLSEQDIDDLVAFLSTLTDGYEPQ